jgi:hypothetical protein
LSALKSLWNGHGSTESTRSARDMPCAFFIWPHNTSDT